jgi:hypothetical protein
MNTQPVFAGLVFDEEDQLVETALVGNDPCYVVNDDGFMRHIPSEEVDRQILKMMYKHIEGHEEVISEQAISMLGQDDIFSRAILIDQLKNIERQFDQIIEEGLPEEGRTYMGMTGFKVIINRQGEVLDVIQPGMIDDQE